MISSGWKFDNETEPEVIIRMVLVTPCLLLVYRVTKPNIYSDITFEHMYKINDKCNTKMKPDTSKQNTIET